LVPSWTILPLSMTRMRSAFWIVERRCAITNTVRAFIRFSRAPWTSFSLCVSR